MTSMSTYRLLLSVTGMLLAIVAVCLARTAPYAAVTMTVLGMALQIVEVYGPSDSD
jgi:hypothetical protein